MHKGMTKSIDGRLVLRRFICCKEGITRPNLISKTTILAKVRKFTEIKSVNDISKFEFV